MGSGAGLRSARVAIARRSNRFVVGVGVAMVLISLAGCSSAGASPSNQGGSQMSDNPTASPQPAATGSDVTVGTSAPLVSGDPGTVTPAPGKVVKPQPGQLDVHPVRAQALSTFHGGPHNLVNVDYTSGVQPCHVLDSVLITRSGNSIVLTLLEGHFPDAGVCSEITEAKRTIVDLGDLDPGHYTISDATGGAATITLSTN